MSSEEIFSAVQAEKKRTTGRECILGIPGLCERLSAEDTSFVLETVNDWSVWSVTGGLLRLIPSAPALPGYSVIVPTPTPSASISIPKGHTVIHALRAGVHSVRQSIPEVTEDRN